MNAHQAIKLGLETASMISGSYLSDLTDADLLVRPVPGANHIAWQVGHLIVSDHDMVETACPGSLPALPEGFAAKYTPDTAKLDSAGMFHPKAVYLKVMAEQRAGVLAALDKLSAADLDKPGPEKFKSWLGSMGQLFSMVGSHWLMHAGQWAVVRRKLGRKPMF